MLAKDRDVRGEIALLHEGIRPHGAHQVPPGHQLPALLDQDQENFDSLRFQGNDIIALDKNVSFPIEAELAKLVNDSWPVRWLASCMRRRARPILPQSPRLEFVGRFLFIVLRLWGLSQEKPKIFPRTDFSNSDKVLAMPRQHFHQRRKRRNL